MPWVTETLASQSMRFRTFHLSGFPFDGTLLGQFTECPAPVLRDLLIWPTRGVEEHPLGDRIKLPLIFAGYLPRLRRLSLANVDTWPANNFNDLRAVHLKNAAQGLTYAEYFDFLAASPCLEELTMESSGPSGEYVVPPDLQIALPRLEKIRMVEVPSVCVARLLTHLKPADTLSIRIFSPPVDGLRPASVLATMSRLEALRQVTKLALSTAFSRGQHRRRLNINGAGLSRVELIGAGADPHEMASNQYMAAAVAFITACDVKELAIMTNDDVIVREELWQRLLFVMPSVTKLTLGPSFGRQSINDSPPPSPLGGSGLLSALFSGDESVGRALPCPSLKELVLLGHISLSSQYAPSDSVSAEIRLFLEERKSRGFPLERVIFVELDSQWTQQARAISAQYANGLRDFVRDVQVVVRQALPEM